MLDLISTAQAVQLVCEKNKWDFCFIGGLALQFWGEQRLTTDVDLTLFVGFGNEEPFIDLLINSFKVRMSDAKLFALKSRVVLLETEGGIGIDVSLGAFPFERSMTTRAQYREYLPEVRLRICSPEDLIVSKAFADRKRDWLDIESVIIKQESLDWIYINAQLAPLVKLKEQPEILTKLAELRKTSG
jgi:hypothetical protein